MSRNSSDSAADRFISEVKARSAAATFRRLKPYTYSPCGYHPDDHAVSLDGATALNPMPKAVAGEVCRALLFAESARTDIDRLVAGWEQARDTLRNLRDNWDCDKDAHRYGNHGACRCCVAAKALAQLDRIAAFDSECVCGETGSRNCPVHAAGGEDA